MGVFKGTIGSFLSVFVAVFLLCGVALANQFQEAVGAYERGDYTTAARLFRPLAERGDADAKFMLGYLYYKLALLYYKGQGVPKDLIEAAKWYRLAAEQGDAKAQVNLGLLYNIGQGVTQNYVEAHMWWNLAAAQGHEAARINRDVVAKEITTVQLAEAQKRAREFRSVPEDASTRK